MSGPPPITLSAPGTVDYFAAWRDWLSTAADPRLDSAHDLEFWERAATSYHTREGAPERCPATLDYLSSLLRPADSVLDAGCGAARFAIAVAARCTSVTALDHSPAMLSAARLRAAEAGVANIEFVEGAIEDGPLPRADVVVAAWCLYRQLDLRLALTNLVGAANRLLVIVAPDSSCLEREPAAYLHVLGAFRQLGHRAELRMFSEPHPERDRVAVPVITLELPEATR